MSADCLSNLTCNADRAVDLLTRSCFFFSRSAKTVVDKREISFSAYMCVCVCVWLCVDVCVCVREREREREKKKESVCSCRVCVYWVRPFSACALFSALVWVSEFVCMCEREREKERKITGRGCVYVCVSVGCASPSLCVVY